MTEAVQERPEVPESRRLCEPGVALPARAEKLRILGLSCRLLGALRLSETVTSRERPAERMVMRPEWAPVGARRPRETRSR